MIVVLDTNIWISALVFAGQHRIPPQALEKAITEDLIATCDEIEDEILRVLTEKFEWSRSRAHDVIERILLRSIHLTLTGNVRRCRDPRDPHDDKFLECAALAQADLLVAGDRDLLVLGSYGETKIISPAQYVRREWN